MLDYYSEVPGPTEDHAKKTIQSKFYKTNVHNKYKIFLNNIKHGGETQAKLINEAFKYAEIINDGIVKFSFSGWMLFGIPDVMSFLKIAIENYYDKMKIRMLGLFKSLVYLNMIYNDTIEKMYSPDSTYVSNVIKSHYIEINKNRTKTVN